MRRYETLFILRPDLGESQIKEAVRRFEGIAASGGEVIETEEWGLRELAYRIKGQRRGYYVRLDYAAPPAVLNEVERNLKLQDTVLRYLSVLVDADADVAKAREEVEARRRRIAEARAQAEARAMAQLQQRAGAAPPESRDSPAHEAAVSEDAEQPAEPERDREQD